MTLTSIFLFNPPHVFGISEPTVEGVFKYPNVLLRTFTWHDDFVTGDAFGGELITVAVVAEQRLVLAGEGLICQRAITAEAAEAVLVIMSVLVEEFLAATQKQQRFKQDHHITEIKLT